MKGIIGVIRIYGPPTGRKVSYRAIADCHVVENVIVEEWLVRDKLTLIYQLGFDVHEMARKLAAQEVDVGRWSQFLQKQIGYVANCHRNLMPIMPLLKLKILCGAAFMKFGIGACLIR